MAYDPFIGEIMVWSGTFAPKGWAFCEGQLLPIMQNQALYSLLGTQYGGDGRTTFALPDLRGRVPVHRGDLTSGIPLRAGDSGGAAALSFEGIDLPAAAPPAVANVMAMPEGNGVDIMPPFLALNFVIALWGIYPSRD
jgi:microcystin-dependent protein